MEAGTIREDSTGNKKKNISYKKHKWGHSENIRTGKGSMVASVVVCFLFSCFLCVLLESSSCEAKSWVGETSMAGLSVTLDRYCAVLEKKTAQEKSTQKQSAVQKKEKQEEEKDTMQEGVQEPAYDKKLGISLVSYLNVHSEPSVRGRVIGKMPKYAGCHIVAKDGDWAMITSGQVKGWVALSSLSTGKEGNALAKKIGGKGVRVTTQTLNVRELPSIDAKACDSISEEETYHIEKKDVTSDWLTQFASKNKLSKKMKKLKQSELKSDLSNWMAISIDEETVFVNKDFVKMDYTLKQAFFYSDYEEHEEEKREKSAQKNTGNSSSDTSNQNDTNYDSTESGSVRNRMVQFAMKYLGNRYVWGGTSLTNGTDCSGFTMRIYEHFGIHIPRTSYQQAAAFKSISRSQLKKGDLIFYGSGGKVSHVAMYIGNNKVIHASNHVDGIKISYAFYRTPIKMGRKLS